MKQIFTLLLLLSPYIQVINGQEIVQTNQGSNYRHTVFVDLNTQEQTVIDFTKWDIAFTTGARSASILVNEGTVYGVEQGVHLYSTYADNFANVSLSHILSEAFNDETSWDDGAFNSVADPHDPFDYGWGSYDTNIHQVLGTRIFIIQLRDKSYRKIKIDKFDTRQFVFTYAHLDGSNEVKDSVQLSAFADKTLIYYSIKDQKLLDLEPSSWDIQFTRYNTPVEEGDTGEFQDYLVTGVLSNKGTQVVHVKGIDPNLVNYEDYKDDLISNLDAIGYDWKYFNLSTFQYSVPEDEVYFVKTSANEIYKIQFLDFEGASTGISTYALSLEEVSTSSKRVPSIIENTSLYPNPSIGGRFTLGISSKGNSAATVLIHDMSGNEVYRNSMLLVYGFNEIPVILAVQPGNYIASIQTLEGFHNLFLVVQ